MTPSEPVGHLKSARRQNTWSKLSHAESIESLQVPSSQGIKSGFCIVGFLSQFVETLAVYWIKVEIPNVQKSQARWLGRGILFYGQRNWVRWVDKNLSQNICKFHQTCHKSLLCRGVAVATGSSFFHWTNVPCVESRPTKQATLLHRATWSFRNRFFPGEFMPKLKQTIRMSFHWICLLLPFQCWAGKWRRSTKVSSEAYFILFFKSGQLLGQITKILWTIPMENSTQTVT